VFGTITDAIEAFADGFIAINAQYTPEDGSLSEQYAKTDGTPVSAVHLTWSYASALTAFAARRGNGTVHGWGAKGLVMPSGVCHGHLGPHVTVTFNVEKDTVWGGTFWTLFFLFWGRHLMCVFSKKTYLLRVPRMLLNCGRRTMPSLSSTTSSTTSPSGVVCRFVKIFILSLNS
jgi:hypothetical protein